MAITVVRRAAAAARAAARHATRAAAACTCGCGPPSGSPTPAGADNLAGAPWIAHYARALGATVGRGVDLHALPPVTGMLTLGDGASVEPEVDLSGYWLDGDVLHVGARPHRRRRHRRHAQHAAARRAGRHATPRSQPGSAVVGSVPAGRALVGLAGRAESARPRRRWPDERPPRGAALGRRLRRRLRRPVAAARSLAPLAGPARASARPVRDATTSATRPSPALARRAARRPWSGSSTLALLTLVGVRLLGLGLRAGHHPVRSRVGWQVWATERLLDSARTLLFPLYASLLTPVWLRAARRRRSARASRRPPCCSLPKMTTVGDGAFLADDTMVASYELGGGWLRIEPAKVGKRAFLGNSGMAAPGRTRAQARPGRGAVGGARRSRRRARPGSAARR